MFLSFFVATNISKKKKRFSRWLFQVIVLKYITLAFSSFKLVVSILRNESRDMVLPLIITVVNNFRRSQYVLLTNLFCIIKNSLSNFLWITLATKTFLLFSVFFSWSLNASLDVSTTKNTVISPDFLVWRLYGKAQFPPPETTPFFLIRIIRAKPCDS